MVILMLRFLHCADAHLDTPHTIDDLEQADVRRAELRSAFSSMMLYVKQNRIPLLLIAGDLFSHAFLSQETTALLRREFASAPDCQIVIAPGNHDFYAEDTVYQTASFPANVHIFKKDTPECFSLTFTDDSGKTVSAEVWGFANTAPDMNGYEVLDGFRLPEKQPGTHRIFVGHAVLAGTRRDEDTSHAPCLKKEQLAAAGFDYCALGQYHTSDGVRRIEATTSAGKTRTTYFSYAGCLVGRGFSESGVRGALCGTLDFDDNGDTVFSVRRVRIARRRYECLDIDLDAFDDTKKTEAGLIGIFKEAIKQAVSDKKMAAPDRDTALRLTVSGTLPAELLLSEPRIAAELQPLSSLTLIDRTTPCQTEALASDPTLRGAYYQALADKLQSEDPILRETAALALRLGMQELKQD